MYELSRCAFRCAIAACSDMRGHGQLPREQIKRAPCKRDPARWQACESVVVVDGIVRDMPSAA
jgi:hypothetical protein